MQSLWRTPLHAGVPPLPRPIDLVFSDTFSSSDFVALLAFY